MAGRPAFCKANRASHTLAGVNMWSFPNGPRSLAPTTSLVSTGQKRPKSGFYSGQLRSARVFSPDARILQLWVANVHPAPHPCLIRVTAETCVSFLLAFLMRFGQILSRVPNIRTVLSYRSDGREAIPKKN